MELMDQHFSRYQKDIFKPSYRKILWKTEKTLPKFQIVNKKNQYSSGGYWNLLKRGDNVTAYCRAFFKNGVDKILI